MSQEKVNRNKENKKNVKKVMRREKIEWQLTKAGMSVICLLVVAWIGVSVYNISDITDNSEVSLPTYTVNTEALDGYVEGLS